MHQNNIVCKYFPVWIPGPAFNMTGVKCKAIAWLAPRNVMSM